LGIAVGLPVWAQVPGLPPGAKICLDPQFTTRSLVIDPINNFFDETLIYFDKQTNRQRVDITFNNPNETPVRIRIYLFPAQGTSYRFNPDASGGGTCIRGIYDIPLNPLCFDGQNARYMGVKRVGQQTLEMYRFETELTFDTYAVFRRGGLVNNIQFAQPVEIFSRSKTSPHTLSTYLQYFDYQPRVDLSAFTLPAACAGLPPSQ